MLDTIKKFFASDETSGTALLVAAAKIIGEDILEFEPETIHLLLVEKGIKIDPFAWNRLMGALLIVKDATVWKIPSRFVLAANSLISGVAETLPIDIATVEECTLLLNESKFIYPPEELSMTVQEYIRQALIHEGFFTLPRSLKEFVKLELPGPDFSTQQMDVMWQAQKERTAALDLLVKERQKTILAELALLGEDARALV